MDLNQLLHAHQIAKMGQAQTPDHARRAAYADTMAQLAERIHALRKAGGADVLTAPFVAGDSTVA